VTSLRNDTIIYAWRGQADANDVLDRRFRLVHASSDYFYLDCGLGGWIGMEKGGNSWCDPYKSWAQIHSQVASSHVMPPLTPASTLMRM
jgi:hexosaminidase